MNYLYKIEEIKDCLHKHQENMELLGVSDGILGFSLFSYYHYLFTKEESSFDQMVSYLEKAFQMLQEGYSSHKATIESIELGLFLLYLYQNKILEKEEIEEALEVLDETVMAFISQKMEEDDLDYTHGLLLGGYYFSKRDCSQKSTVLQRILDKIVASACPNDEGVYWNFYTKNTLETKVDLGLAHGMSGVVLFLLQLHSISFEKSTCEFLIQKALVFLAQQKRNHENVWFPVCGFEKEYPPYNSLAYGDLGIGYVFLKAGLQLDNEFFKKEGMSILENGARFREETQLRVRDANLLYGAAGLFTFFRMLNDIEQHPSFQEASEYWYGKIALFENNEAPNQKAGFSSFFNAQYEFAHLGFSQGIAGIGIALISKELDHTSYDFLNFLNFN